MFDVAGYTKKFCIMLAGGVALCLLSVPAIAVERQYKIEAAYLYSFFNYITWPGFTTPQEVDKPVICVYGNDPILPYLNYVQSKVVGERALTIKQVKDSDATSNCHMLFVRHRLSSNIVKELTTGHTLIVFKPDDPLDRGGMIELWEDGERIAIKIDKPQLEKNGFQVSSRLLDLAQRVR